IISILGLIFDPNIHFSKAFSLPTFTENTPSAFFSADIIGAMQPSIIPIVIALVMTAIFDATGTIRAVAEQGNLTDKQGNIIDGDKALMVDSVSSILSGITGTSPAAVYIESATGTASGGRTGLTAIV